MNTIDVMDRSDRQSLNHSSHYFNQARVDSQNMLILNTDSALHQLAVGDTSHKQDRANSGSLSPRYSVKTPNPYKIRNTSANENKTMRTFKGTEKSQRSDDEMSRASEIIRRKYGQNSRHQQAAFSGERSP